MEPTISASGELLYQRVLPVFEKDEEFGFFGRYLCQALMTMLQDLDQIVLDTVTHPGWSVIVDPLACPAEWLPWCAQLYGVELVPGSTAAEQREQIQELAPQKRGTVASIRKAVEETLTGERFVFITERPEGKAYHINVHTFTAQTPDPSVTLAAFLTQKPGGLKYTLTTSESPTWEEATKAWNEVEPSVKWFNVAKGDV